ncbi:MAG: endonuclease/exonuclease/phosphatase family protein [Bacteroidales bacterium]|jgi:endonuclease/exonuclease/phosphatase family metal-dependent hydrolase|nr:endonuclease/exonuclease/phosphatase family protein [Bacteroidales bacterium]
MKKAAFILICLILFSFYGCKEEQTTNLTVMSYNIRHGVGMDTILDLSRSEKIIKSQSPDICGLQEVDNFCLRSDSVNQTDYLAQKTFMTGTFAKFMDYQGGEYGMATLTSKPLIATIITGDFNCTPDSPTMQFFIGQGFVFVQKGDDNLSFQGNSKSEIDHVIYRNAGDVKFEKKSIQLLKEPLVSDHRPLVAELKVVF